jgi:hypothetical protein
LNFGELFLSLAATNQTDSRPLLHNLKLMKRIVYTFLAFFFAQCMAYGQGGWQKIYPMTSGGPHGDGIEAVRQTPDGGYVMAGIVAHNSGQFFNRVVKVNFEGSVQWSQTYPITTNSSWAKNIELAPGGGFYIEGYRVNPATFKYEVYIQKIDNLGNQDWINYYPQATYATKGSVTSDGGYIAAGYDYDNVNFKDSIALIKVDALGNTDWVRKYSNATGIAHSIIQTASGEYVLEGFRNNKTFLCKYNSVGDSLWHKEYGVQSSHPEYIGKVIENSDFTLTFVGNNILPTLTNDVYLVKTDEDGNTLWQQHYGFSNAFGTDVASTADGGYIICGYVNGNTSPQVLMIKTNATGSAEWTKIYNGDGSGTWKAYSIRQTADGGYIVGGAKIQSFYTRRNMYLIKTDDLGEIYSNTLQGFVYYDQDGDCEPGAGEYKLKNWLIEIQGNNTHYITTDTAGFYWVRVDTGNYQVILHPSPLGQHWYNAGCAPDTLNLSIPNQYTLIDTSFSRTADDFCPLLTVNMSAPFLRRCFNNVYAIEYCNYGTALAQNATVLVDFDGFLNVDEASISVPWTSVGFNQYLLDVGDIDPGVCGVEYINVQVSCFAVLGQTHCSSVEIYPNESCFLPNWDDALIDLSAACGNDTVIFTISNSGNSASSLLEYRIYQNSTLVLFDNFTLNAGQSMTVLVEATPGATYIIEADQEPGYPAALGDSIVIVGIEGCLGGINPGFITQFPNYDSGPFVDVDCQMNIGAYDPNDKQGFPAGYGPNHYITEYTHLDYKIRFQNTGTDTAFTVIIVDTLSPFLDVASIVTGASSHPYTWRVYGQDVSVLEFTFANIMLPDSNVNEPASHGFVLFSIKQKPGNTVGTVIENTAGIYFDFNEPIITNTTFHEIGDDFIHVSLLSVEQLNASRNFDVKVYPNPFVDVATIEIINGFKATKPCSLSVFDVSGKMVLQLNSDHNKFNLIKGDLGLGMYFFEVNQDGEALGSGKFIVH